MQKKYNRSLFIFRRDLRIDDNTALINACNQSKQVIACFVINPAQTSSNNHYKSNNAIQFMIESLEDLEMQLKKYDGKLHLFYDDPLTVIKQIISELPVDAIFVNADYTTYSKKRDQAIQNLCNQKQIDFIWYDDALLQEPGAATKKDGSMYTIFTPYYKNASQLPVAHPEKLLIATFYTLPLPHTTSIPTIKKVILEKTNTNIAAHGGSTAAKKILDNLALYSNYELERDIPALNKTTHLSAHLKFGTCSVRQAYYSIKKSLGLHHPLLRQLYWRDFFTHIVHFFPHVIGHTFNKKYTALGWKNNQLLFDAWKSGMTGFPIIDAGMRELVTTGLMHNRVRMIVASFLVKDLHIDWRLGEQFFAQHLVDYDPAVNNGNWQWAASTGCDAQPYFRIFNPWLQQKKFDPDCRYIKQWIPELYHLDARTIHTWNNTYTKHHKIGYPKPIVDHAIESKKALVAYKNILLSSTHKEV